MYDASDVVDVIRSKSELENTHPVFRAFMENTIGKTFSRNEVREVVIPAYMGLIKQCDDQMGRLFKYLKDSGEMDNTIIVLTSDHVDLFLDQKALGEIHPLHA